MRSTCHHTCVMHAACATTRQRQSICTRRRAWALERYAASGSSSSGSSPSSSPSSSSSSSSTPARARDGGDTSARLDDGAGGGGAPVAIGAIVDMGASSPSKNESSMASMGNGVATAWRQPYLLAQQHCSNRHGSTRFDAIVAQVELCKRIAVAQR